MSGRRTVVDMGALYAALDAERARRDLTWRGVAAEVGVSPSLLSRMGKGLSPDVTSFMSLCRWLRLPAEGFTVVVGEPREERPAVSAEVATLLARREDVSALDREYSDYGFVGWFDAVFRSVVYSEDRDGKRYVAGAEFDGASLGGDGGWTFRELGSCFECGEQFLLGEGNVCDDCFARMAGLDDGR